MAILLYCEIDEGERRLFTKLEGEMSVKSDCEKRVNERFLSQKVNSNIKEPKNPKKTKRNVMSC